MIYKARLNYCPKCGNNAILLEKNNYVCIPCTNPQEWQKLLELNKEKLTHVRPNFHQG